jgi:ABC-type dipeptide/oligopeptide/nickel transport system ATPase component
MLVHHRSEPRGEATCSAAAQVGEALLDIQNLAIAYQSPDQIPIKALRGVSLRIWPGESIGIVGESGSGKSTLAVSILRLLPPNGFVTSGTIRFRGVDMLSAPGRTLQKIRGAQIAMVFQQPGMALNPHMRVCRQVAEVIHAHRAWTHSRCLEQARHILECVLGCDCDRLWQAYPHQLSGGQSQRVAIAQAIACNPQLIIADEPTSSLDAVVAAGILEIFQDLRRTSSVSLILITHNPAILPGLAERVLVLCRGELLEEGMLRELYRQAREPYTSELLGAGKPAWPK